MRLRWLALIALFCSPGIAQSQSQAVASRQHSVTDWNNIYAFSLGEQHTEQGVQLLKSGDYLAAERKLLDAIHVIKVNHGLHSTLQLAPLQYLIEAQLTFGQWQAAKTQIEYFQWINVRNYRDNLYAYLAGTEKLSGLLLAASANIDNPYAVSNLIAAKNLNWQAVNAIEQTLGPDSLELAPWLYRIVLNHYYQSTMLRRREVSEATSAEALASDSDEIVDSWTRRRNETLDMSYRIGRELLTRIEGLFAHHTDSNAEAAALSTVYQGDWELLFGHNEKALSLYHNAYQSLREHGRSAAEIDRFFSRPVSLPAPHLHMQWPQAVPEDASQPLQFFAWSPMYPTAARPAVPRDEFVESANAQMAIATFDLMPSANGSVTEFTAKEADLNLDNLQILSTTPDNALTREQARVYISLLQFRPRLVAGLPASSENIELRYLFPPQVSLLPLLQQ